MYCAGHLLTSLSLAALVSRRRHVCFAAMGSLMMLVNAIDLDHIFRYRLDDGSADSLRLHPLHVYFAAVGLALFLAGMVDLKRTDYWMGALGALCLHMLMDAMAHAAHYELASLAAADALALAVMLIIAAWVPLGVGRRKLALFAVLVVVLCDGVQALEHFVLGLRMQRDVLVVFIAPAMTVAASTIFWLIFRPRRQQAITEQPTA